MNKKELIEQIKNNFSQVTYPGDEDLTYLPLGFDESFYEAIKGKKWYELKKDLLIYHHDCIGLLTPNGFHYYLPAFLIEDLKEEGGTKISEMLIIELSMYATNDGSPVKGLSGQQWLNDRMKLFSKEQIEVIINFFNFYRIPNELAETIEDIDNIISYFKNRKWENI